MNNQTYPPVIMHDKYDECTDEELTSVLVTCDGRGKINKEKALRILLNRYYDVGVRNEKRGMS